MKIQPIGTPLSKDSIYKVGDPVFIHHRVKDKIQTTIGFLIYTANRDVTILARTLNPPTDFIEISDDDFIMLGHIKHLKPFN